MKQGIIKLLTLLAILPITPVLALVSYLTGVIE